MVRLHNGDCRAYLYSLVENQKPTDTKPFVGKFDIIDIDPPGSAVPYIDAAIHGINDGGILCLTFQDDNVLTEYVY